MRSRTQETMPIKVNISLSAGGRFKPVSSHTLHEKRITVGRDKECTLTLEDTQKHVSRMHAEFEQDDGGYWLKVVSKVNPVVVNGKRYAYGDRVALADGDQVNVGLYKLEIVTPEVGPPPAKAAPPVQAGPAEPPVVDRSEETTYVPPPKADPPAAPQPETGLPESAAEKEEDTYIPPATVVASPSPPQAPSFHSVLPESAALDDEVTYIPPMWARLAATRPASGAGPTHDSDITSDDLTHIRRPPTAPVAPPEPAAAPASPESLDLDLSEAFDAPQEQAAPAQRPPEPEPEVEEGFSDDLTYVRRPPPKPPSFSPAVSAPAALAQPAPAGKSARPAKEETGPRTPLQEIAARIAARATPPSTTLPPATPLADTPPAARPATRPADQNTDRSVQAFLDGAGLAHLQIPDPETFMRESGAMARAAVEGIGMLLQARAEARKELGAEIDAGADDNPVTSMATPDEVIAFLFDPKRPAIGDTNPVQAFSDACTDLHTHQVALIAGMRAAVMTVLLKIDPKKIEREHGVSLGGLNLTRKSKLWDISVAQHERLAREMDENFNNVFGPEILAAYAAHVRKTRGDR